MIWHLSIKLLEQHNMFYSNPQLKQFSWHAASFLQWHTVIHILDTLQADPFVSQAEKAWELIASIFQHHSDIILDTKKPFYVAIGNLCLKAYSARELALREDKLLPNPIWKFILHLRQQRGEARQNLQERDAKRLHRNHLGVATNPDIGQQLNGNRAPINCRPGEPHDEPAPSDSAILEESPFWFDGLYDGQSLESANAMDVDVDFLLAYYDANEENATQSISWEQWDEWLANSKLE
jgi:hypothetical protein